jgi:aminoglycoside phosphotransferase (APT) family kinase protein
MGPYAIKYGTTVRQMEGENMLFVRANTTMPVPQLYAMEFYGPGDGNDRPILLIMERVQGNVLTDGFVGRLHRAERQRIGLELASHVEQLRRIRAAPDYYGALGCNPIHSKGLSASVGPSDSHLRFAEDFFNLMKRAASSRRKKRFAAALHEVALRKRSGYPVFTHGDLHGRNVIVRANGKACIIDYELSGFMPAWYEFAFKGGVFDKLGMDYGRGFREERVILDSFHEYSH